MMKYNGSHVCIFCGQSCVDHFYWHEECKVKFMKEDK